MIEVNYTGGAMLKRFSTVTTLSLLLTACAGGPPPEPPPPPPADPAGSWNVSVALEGMDISGVLSIRGSAEDGYTGSIDTDLGGASIANVVVDGQTVTFTIPDAGVDVALFFEGDEFTGELGGAMGVGSIRGVKRAGS